MMSGKSAFLAAGLCVLAFGGQPALAADADDFEPGPRYAESGHPSWALQITPYAWATGLEGRVSPFRRGPVIDVEKSFDDILDDLDFAGFINVWARYGRFVFSGDVMYVDTSNAEAIGPLPPLPLPVPVPPGISADVDVASRQFMATLQGGYRIHDGARFTLDTLAGARIWRISNEVTVSALGRSLRLDESFGWVDPVLGARAFLNLTDRLSILAQGDIGGFGAGADFSWSLLATVNYALSDHVSLSAGYRMLDVDFDRRGHVYDVRLQGPVLGATWRF